MDDYQMTLDSQTEMFCTLYLFTNVENVNQVRSKVINGELSCSVIKPSLIADPFHVLVAANKAAISLKSSQLITKGVHTELLFNLSMSNNISRSLMDFGVNDSDKNILLALIHKLSDTKSILKSVTDIVQGEKVSISRLPEFTDLELIKKIYKINKEELNVSSITNSIASRISCKEFIALK